MNTAVISVLTIIIGTNTNTARSCWSSLVSLRVVVELSTGAIHHPGQHLQLAAQHGPQQVVDGVLAHQVDQVARVALTDAVDAILRLHQNRRCPEPNTTTTSCLEVKHRAKMSGRKEIM
jgi:hypothetical protein